VVTGQRGYDEVEVGSGVAEEARSLPKVDRACVGVAHNGCSSLGCVEEKQKMGEGQAVVVGGK
jgi:hypothetical protein